MKLRMKKGFTLIELLVVIAIIGILAALIIISLSGAQKRARDTQRKNNARSIDTALAQYYVDNSSTYPTGTVTLPTTGATSACAGLAAPLITTGQYLSSDTTCKDPNKTTTYGRYVTSTANDAYAFAWLLENTAEKEKATGTVAAGNGVYLTGAGAAGATSLAVTVNGATLTLGGLNGNSKYFVVYGPQ